MRIVELVVIDRLSQTLDSFKSVTISFEMLLFTFKRLERLS